MYFDAWDSPSQSWKVAGTWIQALRSERKQPHLYELTEWLAKQEDAFWASRAKSPVRFAPREDVKPTADDARVLFAILKIQNSPRFAEARAAFDRLKTQMPDYQTFNKLAPRTGEDFMRIDDVICAYERAAVIIKYGALAPELYFAVIPSVADAWKYAAPWVRGMRAELHNEHTFDNFEWLAHYEEEWRSRHP
jgi:hypothetical protein